MNPPTKQHVLRSAILAGRFAAIRYRLLLALSPSGYRIGSDLFGVGDSVDFERLVEWPAGLLDEVTHVRSIGFIATALAGTTGAREVCRH